MSDQDKTTLLSSRLYTEASQKLEEETDKEKKIDDPDMEEAEAAIDAAQLKGDQQ